MEEYDEQQPGLVGAENPLESTQAETQTQVAAPMEGAAGLSSAKEMPTGGINQEATPARASRRKPRDEEEMVVIDDEEPEAMPANLVIQPQPEGESGGAFAAHTPQDEGQPRKRGRKPKSQEVGEGQHRRGRKKRKQAEEAAAADSILAMQNGLQALNGLFPNLSYQDLTRLAALLQLVVTSPQALNLTSWGSALSGQQALNDQNASRKRWCEHEEAALQAGVAKYGVGKWKAIKRDPAFGPHLERRNNVHLKDKWRNMVMSLERNKDEHLVFSRSRLEKNLAQQGRSGGDGEEDSPQETGDLQQLQHLQHLHPEQLQQLQQLHQLQPEQLEQLHQLQQLQPAQLQQLQDLAQPQQLQSQTEHLGEEQDEDDEQFEEHAEAEGDEGEEHYEDRSGEHRGEAFQAHPQEGDGAQSDPHAQEQCKQLEPHLEEQRQLGSQFAPHPEGQQGKHLLEPPPEHREGDENNIVPSKDEQQQQTKEVFQTVGSSS